MIAPSHSAKVKISLNIGDASYMVASLMDGRCILRDEVNQHVVNESSQARLTIDIDGVSETHEVVLPHGISSKIVTFF